MKYLVNLTILFFISLSNGHARNKSSFNSSDFKNLTKIYVNTDQIITLTDPRFLSVSIDTATLLGIGIFKKSPDEVSPKIDFNNKRLNYLTESLSPAYLRIGGTDADKISYDLNSELTNDLSGDRSGDGSGELAGRSGDRSGESAGRSGVDVDPDVDIDRTKYVLRKADWDGLLQFVNENSLSLFFTVNAGPLSRSSGKYFTTGQWQSEQFQSLLDYANRNSHKNITWELGNEINAYWLIHGWRQYVGAEQYARDYQNAKNLIQTFRNNEKLAGPASAVWPIVGETIPKVTEMIPHFLDFAQEQNIEVDILTWHFYATQSNMCKVNVRSANLAAFRELQTFNEFREWSLRYKKLRDKYQDQSKKMNKTALWLGEVGPAQCGGQEGLSDRFVSTLWWLDQLGAAALYGNEVVIRQSLVGSHYGLLAPDDYSPRPDYWTSLLWKQIMGREVFAGSSIVGVDFVDSLTAGIVSLEDSLHEKSLRVYAHCTSKNSPYYRAGALSLLLINLSLTDSQYIRSERFPWLEWTISADSLLDKKLLLNSKQLELSDINELPKLNPIIHDKKYQTIGEDFLYMAPATATFIILPNADIKLCR